MQIVSFFGPDDNPHAVRDSLRRDGVSRVAMRAGWLWTERDGIEADCTHIYAPGYPGIVRKYVAAGLHEIKESVENTPPPPREVVELPQAAEVSILSAGAFLEPEMAAVAPRGLTIAINEAGNVCHPDWLLCNDGFANPHFRTPRADVVRACRGRDVSTVPTGPWFDLTRIGISEGLWSVCCALKLSGAMGAKVVWLYGHDLKTGKGIQGRTTHWSGSQCRDCDGETQRHIAALRSAGVDVRWVQMGKGDCVTVNGKDARRLPVTEQEQTMPPVNAPANQAEQ